MKLHKKVAYKTIDEMPIYNWNKIHETGDLRYLLHDKCRIEPYEFRFLLKRWKKIYEEYVNRFGFSEEFLSILELEKNIALLKIEKAERGDENIQTFIEIDQIKLEKKKAELNAVNSDFYDMKAAIESNLGFHIDPKKCTVIEFYSYLKNIKKKNAKST